MTDSTTAEPTPISPVTTPRRRPTTRHAPAAGSRLGQILRTIAATGSATAAQIMAAVPGISIPYIGASVQNLVRRGYVERTSKGVYALTPAGADALRIADIVAAAQQQPAPQG